MAGEMERAENSESGKRPVVYCLVPFDLGGKLHEPLRKHFADDSSVEVIVERRSRERRRRAERRAGEEDTVAGGAGERRRIRAEHGRRMAERRAPLVSVALPEALPRKVRAHADRLTFVERLEPTSQHLEDLDTARVVSRIQAGDDEAFGILYIRYFDRVYNYLRVVLNDPHEAEDGTQQVFMKVLEALPRYELRTEPFRAWLFIIVRNHAVSLVRKRSRVETVEPAEMNRRAEAPPELDMPELRSLGWVSDKDLLMLVERLPLAQRQVILLRYMLDLSHAQIAETLDKSPEQVRALQHRALTFFRQRLDALGRGGERPSRSRLVRRPGHAYVLRKRRFALLD